LKLTLKLALALVPGALIVIAAAAFLELRRDRAEFEADQRADDRAVAGALADNMAALRAAAGEQAMRAAMDRVRTVEAHFRVCWVELDDAGLPPPERAALGRGEEVLWRAAPTRSGPGWLHVVAPVRVGAAVIGGVDVSEPPLDLRAQVGRTIRDTLLTTLVLAATMMLLTLLVGVWLVGGPVSVLIGQARRVAGGDLGARSQPHQRDELGELGRELNRMLDRLEAAADEVRASTRERFAALEQLRHAERLTTVGRLASSVAHELGTPLNVVAGRARLVIEDEREARTHAGIIIAEAQRMTKIIRQLLDYARRRPPEKKQEDLARLAADTLSLVATLASKRRVELAFAGEGGGGAGSGSSPAPAPVTVDPAQVQQALTNLVVNAIQASAEGGRVDVSLRAARARRPGAPGADASPEADGFALTVCDHGPGMPPEVLARVFEPFFTTKPVGEATGLGLSVAHDILDEHGGWIAAESEPGHGSRFTIFLPRSPT
jgi:signal transduction histidine kinase